MNWDCLIHASAPQLGHTTVSPSRLFGVESKTDNRRETTHQQWTPLFFLALPPFQNTQVHLSETGQSITCLERCVRPSSCLPQDNLCAITVSKRNALCTELTQSEARLASPSHTNRPSLLISETMIRHLNADNYPHTNPTGVISLSH